MTTEEYIREYAARGYSKTMTLEALGLCRETFYAMLEAMPSIQWPARGQSLACKLANESRRGISTPGLRAAAEKARRTRREKHSHIIDGVKGTIEVHAARYGISGSTVRRRVKAGMTLNQALKTPVTPIPARHKGFSQRFTA